MRWILYILAFLVVLVLAGFLFPREVTLERSVYIAKPPQAVFPYVNDFRNFNSWSPWYQLDPTTEYEYSEPSGGLGATMSWRSDDTSVGSGSQTITASEPYSLVRTDLDFGGQGTAVAEFRLQPQGSGTNVTWWFSSDMGSGPIARWMGLLVNNMVGKSYQQGLDKLKNMVESSATPSEAGESGTDMDKADPGSSDMGDTEAGDTDMDMDNGSDTELAPEQDQIGTDPGEMDPEIETPALEEESEEPVEENYH
jgi:uncharacterized protein YndB with AHSA1/START domain